MSLFLAPRKASNTAIAICGRCKMKRYYADLVRDGENKGLYVCKNNPMCRDDVDPYTLPPHPVEKINLRHPRRDEDVST